MPARAKPRTPMLPPDQAAELSAILTRAADATPPGVVRDALRALAASAVTTSDDIARTGGHQRTEGPPDVPLAADLIPLSAARLLIPARGGSHPHIDRVRAWVRSGKLDGYEIGGCYFTTAEAVEAFIAGSRVGGAERTPTQMQKAGEKAAERLFERIAARKKRRAKAK